MSLTEDQSANIESARSEAAPTRRVTVPAMEELLYQPKSVLDHGFVRVVDYMGDDAAVVQAARVSYGRGTRKVSQDAGLIRYLMRHRHSTPFEMCEIKFHVKLPIFVARQWIRHRTANVNEYSARYSVLDKEFYVPDLEYIKHQRRKDQEPEGQASLFPEDRNVVPIHTAAQSRTNRQGREDVLSPDDARQVLEILQNEGSHAYRSYLKLLNEDIAGNQKDPSKVGIARELARLVLPVNIYTQWYWKTNLHNLMHFLSLRSEPHAQYEIRAYAEAMQTIMQSWVPLTYAAFCEYRLGAATFSATMLEVLRRKLAGENVEQATSGLSTREWAEMMAALGLER